MRKKRWEVAKSHGDRLGEREDDSLLQTNVILLSCLSNQPGPPQLRRGRAAASSKQTRHLHTGSITQRFSKSHKHGQLTYRCN